MFRMITLWGTIHKGVRGGIIVVFYSQFKQYIDGNFKIYIFSISRRSMYKIFSHSKLIRYIYIIKLS